MLEKKVEKGTSLDIVKSYKDSIKTDYGELLTKTRTAIGVGRAEDGKFYLAFRTTQENVDLSQIEKRIPDDVQYMIEYVGEIKLRNYQKPEIKRSKLIDRKLTDLIMFLTKGDESKVREFVCRMVQESGALEINSKKR